MGLKTLLLGICLGMFFSGCMMNVRQKKTTDETDQDTAPSGLEKDTDAPTVQYTFLDTLNRGNELHLTDEDFGEQSDKVERTTSKSAASSGTRYRVQLLASSRIETVREQKKTVEKKLSEPVVIGYEAPYYKLYAGNFLNRKDAQALLPKIKRLGFQDAWIVTTKTVAEN